MTKIALQTFTVRRFMQNEKDLDNTLKKLSEMGIKNLELAYIPWTERFIDTLSRYLKKYDMMPISSQIKLSIIEKNLDMLIKIHNSLGIKYMAISVIPFRNLLLGRSGIKRLATRLNKLGKVLKKNDIQLMFHHHNYEFIRFGRKTQFDYICEMFDPEYVQILSDTYWIRKGNYNIIEFFEKYKSHIKACHLRGHLDEKDSNITETDSDFVEVINYIKKNNFYYGAIEQNTENEFEEIQKSLSLIENEFSDMLGE